MHIEVLTTDWPTYRLLDSGNGRKLEQFGSVRIVRGEPKAWWRPALAREAWYGAHAVHEDEGRWRFPCGQAPKEWELAFPLAAGQGAGWLRFQLRFMDSSKQIGLFPEQAPHWCWLAAQRAAAGQPPRALNLFGYTGAATLACAAAGWHVTHVDASRPAVSLGRRNQALSKLGDAPIRWIIEDATKFVQREERRGGRYEAILLDPPVFGRGPGGELWKIERDLPPLLDACRAILSETARFILLTVYTIDASAILCHNLLGQMTAGLGGSVSIGELTHHDEAGGRLLPLSLWGRWECAGPAR
ncbi:MAG: class I SAM-dependent methyltransferase [Puniceicoccales bacterium]|jgi:23S rRNA (cytosine1962-C5)-methyltransferase|nr:class I SAM-dependent methyltransferase [Puniceicoccales bacterium]